VKTKFYGSFVFNATGAESTPTASIPSKGMTPPEEMTPDRSSGEEIEVVVMEAPPFTAKASSDPESCSRAFPTLKQISVKGDDIIDNEKWIAENGIEPVFLDVPNAMMGTPGELPATVPARAGQFIAVRAFRDEIAGYVIYGEGFSAGPVLTVWIPDFATVKARIDLSNYRTAPKVVPGDEGYVDQATRFATVRDGILYVSHDHNTCAKSSGVTELGIERRDLILRFQLVFFTYQPGCMPEIARHKSSRNPLSPACPSTDSSCRLIHKYPDNKFSSINQTHPTMRTKILLLISLLLVALIVVIATRPATFSVTRSIVSSAPPAVVFSNLNDFRKWEDWSPWAKLDPNSDMVFEGPETGTGAIFKWSGNSEVGRVLPGGLRA